MTVLRGSRYEGVPYTGIQTEDCQIKKFLHDRRIISLDDVKTTAVEHTIVGEQQLDTLANLYYKDERLWWVIADVNDILFPLDVEPGQVVLIPDPAVSLLADQYLVARRVLLDALGGVDTIPNGCEIQALLSTDPAQHDLPEVDADTEGQARLFRQLCIERLNRFADAQCSPDRP